MGLYLCVFDGDEEVEGVEIGSYADFNTFRDAVTAVVENGLAGSVCPVLLNHSDCDGLWSSGEAELLLNELRQIERIFSASPPVEINSPWKNQVAKSFGIKPANLAECFFDVDGEPLIARLMDLAEVSKSRNFPVLFQ